MNINIKEIIHEIERDWDEPVEGLNEFFAEETHNTLSISKPFHVRMKLTKIGDDIDVNGHLSVKLNFLCDRCCEDASKLIEDDFHFLLMPTKEEKVEESEFDTEEVEVSYFEGEEIDLSFYAKEQFLLSIPIKLLCKDDCKGICPKCGANLNLEKCECNRGDFKKSPFSVLKNQK